MSTRRYYAAEYLDKMIQVGLLDELEYSEAGEWASTQVEVARRAGLIVPDWVELR